MPSEAASDPSQPRARRARLVGALSLGLVAALGGAWFYRIPLGEALIRQSLALNGAPADLNIERLDFGGATIRAIRVGSPEAPDLWVETARLDLDWRRGLPRLSAITIDKGYLIATFGDGRVSFGALDKLATGKPTRATAKIPDWAITVRDFRFTGKTPLGPFDAAVSAQGRLHADFRGAATIKPTTMIGPGGRAEAVQGVLRLATIDQRLTGALSLSAAGAAWRPVAAEPALQLSAPRLQARFAAPMDLKGASLTATLDAGAVRQKGALDIAALTAKASVKTEGFTPGFRPGRFAGAYEITLADAALGALHAPRMTARGPLAGDFSLGNEHARADGAVALIAASLRAPARRALIARLPGLGGTPLQPLMTAGKDGLDRALLAFDAAAPLTLAWDGKAAALSASGAITFDARSGARLTAAARKGGGPPLTIGLADGRWSVAADVDIRGGRLPEASALVMLNSAKAAGLDARVDLTVRDWRADHAALRADALTLTLASNQAGGRARLRGDALVSGPFAGARLVDLRAPLDLAVDWDSGGGFRAGPAQGACIALRTARIEAPGVTFVDAPARVCTAATGGFVAADAQGRLTGGFVIDGVDWSGAMQSKGREPARLTTARLVGDVGGTADDMALTMTFAAPEFSATYPQQRRLRARAAAVTARLNASARSWSIAGLVQKLDFHDTSLPVQVADFDAAWSGAPRADGQAVFRLTHGEGRIFDPADKALYHPLRANAVSASLADGMIRASGDLLLEDKGRAIAVFTANHDLARGVGELHALAKDLTFTSALQPYDITELARGFIDNVEGPVDADLFARWTPQGAATGAVATIKDVNLLSSSLGPVEGLAGTLVFDDLGKVTSPPGQRLTVRKLNPGIMVENGAISLHFRENQVIEIESARWPFAEGVLSVEPTTISLVGEETRLSLALNDVDVGALTRTLNFKGLTATGKVEGRFPLVFTKTHARIEDGRLEAAPGGGTIGYQSEAHPAGAAGLAFDALRTFRYDNLSISLNGDLDGDVVSAIKFEGVNREPIDPGGSIVPLRVVGIPFRFNVTVTAPFMTLAQSAAGMADARRYYQGAAAEVEAEADGASGATPPPAPE